MKRKRYIEKIYVKNKQTKPAEAAVIKHKNTLKFWFSPASAV